MNLKLDDFIKSDLPNKDQLLSCFRSTDELTIFDIGACEAEDSIRYSKLFPNASIYSFEPLPANFAKCRNNINKYGITNVKLFDVALSNKQGEAVFHISNGNPESKQNTDDWDYGNKSSSLLEPDKVKEVFNWLKFDTKIKVRTETIKAFCKQENISQIDIIHMDVQGAELMVLEGAGKWIEKTKVIWLEVENVSLYKDQPLEDDIERYFKNNGFNKLLDKVIGVAGDIFYVNTKYFENKSVISKVSLWNKIYYKYFNEYYYKQKCYSQHGEDLIIDSCLQSIGIHKPSYLDIGSHHPYRLNNTYRFYLRGSRGINIEPDPKLFHLFTTKRSKDLNLNIGVYDHNTELTFYLMHPSTLNTFNENECENYIKLGHKKVGETRISVRRIDDILNEFNDGVFPDLLSIDIEGLDLLVLKTINLDHNYPKVICVETTLYDGNKVEQHKNHELINYLLNKGYRIYADTFINTIFYKV